MRTMVFFVVLLVSASIGACGGDGGSRAEPDDAGTGRLDGGGGPGDDAGTPDAGPTVSIEDPGDQSAVLGAPLAVTVSATASAGTTVFSSTGGALPDGINLDPDTGQISGTPTIPALLDGDPTGTYGGVVVTATAAGVSASTAPFAIAIEGVPLPAPELYWTYDNSDTVDDVLEDASGNGHDGTAFGGSTSGVEGAIAEAWAFDGTTGFAQATGVPAPGGDYSLLATVNPSATDIGPRIAVEYGLSDPAPTFRGTWIQMGEGGDVIGVFEDGADRVATSAARINAGEWTPLGISWTEATLVGRLYVAGFADGEVTTEGPVLYATDNIETGRHAQFNERYWQGAIDEVAFFHEALSDEQMATYAWLIRTGQSLGTWLARP